MHQEKGVHVKFELFPVLHGLESKAAGREIYKDKPHVRIRVAGQDKQEFFGPVNDQIKARFPDEWDQFQRGIETPRTGTPLHAWGRITPAIARNLESLNIYTVEDIATLSEAGLDKLGMGARPLQEDARKFLSQSQLSADLARLESLEVAAAAKDATIAEQGQKLAEQGQALAELQAQVARLLEKDEPAVDPAEPVRRGRPRKAEATT